MTKTLRKQHQKGFTLVEILLASAIVVIIGAVLAPLLINSAKQYSLVANRKNMLANARLAMDRMTYDMRFIKDTASITTFTASEFQFDNNIENNIDYILNGTNLQRSGSNLASNVTALAFTYLDANGAVTAVKANIVSIRFQITVSAGSGFGSLTLRNTVYPRRFTNAYNTFN